MILIYQIIWLYFQYLHIPAKDLTEAINKFPKLERHMWGILAARKLAPLYAQMKQFRVSLFLFYSYKVINFGIYRFTYSLIWFSNQENIL